MDEFDKIPAGLSMGAYVPPVMTTHNGITVYEPDRLGLLQREYGNIFEMMIEAVCRGCAVQDVLESETRLLSYEHFMLWVRSDRARRARFEEAQEIRAEILAGELLKIADDDDDVARSKLRIDTRKYLMGAWSRRRYADTKTIDVTNTVSVSGALDEARGRIIDITDIKEID